MKNPFNPDVELTLGVEEMDNEHCKFAEMLNHIDELLREEKSVEARAHFNRSLSLYIDEHFTNEECFMESFGFSGIEDHKKLHSSFRELFENSKHLIKTYDDTSFRQVLSDVFVWLIVHMGSVDKKYFDYYFEQKPARLTKMQPSSDVKPKLHDIDKSTLI